MKNPKWHRDELILALDLYLRLKPGQIHAKNPEIIELSDILNKLPIHNEKPDAVKFRNANGVGLKLSNFLAIDPSYLGKGMASYSKLDKEVFEEFREQKKILKRIAINIKKAIINPDFINLNILSAEEAHYFAKEGKTLYRLHRYKERNISLVNKKKQQYLKRYGNLACELCHFDFYTTYGDVGKGFAECHHKTPLYSLDVERNTHLDDLMIICSNCHKMVHRGWIMDL